MTYDDRPFSEKPASDRAGAIVGTVIGLCLSLPFWYFTLIEVPLEIARAVSG